MITLGWPEISSDHSSDSIHSRFMNIHAQMLSYQKTNCCGRLNLSCEYCSTLTVVHPWGTLNVHLSCGRWKCTDKKSLTKVEVQIGALKSTTYWIIAPQKFKKILDLFNFENDSEIRKCFEDHLYVGTMPNEPKADYTRCVAHQKEL